MNQASGFSIFPRVVSFALSTLLSLAVTTNAFAQASAAPKQTPVTVQEVLAEALQGNMDLRRERVAIQSAHAQVLAAQGQFDVVLNGSLVFSQAITPPVSATDLSGGTSNAINGDIGLLRQLETGGSVRLGLNQSLTESTQAFLCGPGVPECQVHTTRLNLAVTHPLLRNLGTEATQANLRRRKIQVDLAYLNRQARAAIVVRDVLTGYWELAFASQDLEIRRAAVELANRQLEATQAQIGVGRLAPIDAAAVERAISDRTREVVAAEQSVLFRSLDLVRLMGKQPQANFDRMVAAEAPVVTPHPVDVAAELGTALKNNPQLQSLRQGIALTELDIRTASVALRPQLDLVGQFGSTGRQVDSITNAFDQAVRFENLVWSLGLNFNVPVQNRAARGFAEVARLANDRSWVDAGALELEVRDTVVRLSSSVGVAARRIELGEQVVNFAEQNLQAEEARFSVGRATNNDVLLRQQELNIARSQLLRARVDLLVAEIALDAITGAVLDRYGLELKPF